MRTEGEKKAEGGKDKEGRKVLRAEF